MADSKDNEAGRILRTLYATSGIMEADWPEIVLRTVEARVIGSSHS